MRYPKQFGVNVSDANINCSLKCLVSSKNMRNHKTLGKCYFKGMFKDTKVNIISTSTMKYMVKSRNQYRKYSNLFNISQYVCVWFSTTNILHLLRCDLIHINVCSYYARMFILHSTRIK